MKANTSNLVKIFAKEINEGNWVKSNVPSAILADVEEELQRLQKEGEKDNGTTG